MELENKILRNEIQNMGQIMQVISYELTLLQDFIQEKYGASYEEFRKRHAQPTESEVPSHAPKTARKSTSKRTTRLPNSDKPSPSQKIVRKQEPSDVEEIDDDEGAADFPGHVDVGELSDILDPLDTGDSPGVAGNDARAQASDESDDSDFDPGDQPKRIKLGDLPYAGRKRKAIWAKYKISRLSNGKLRAKCHICQEAVSCKASRLEGHYKKCKTYFSNLEDNPKGISAGELEAKERVKAEKRKVTKHLKNEAKLNEEGQTPSAGSSKRPGIGRQLDPVWGYFNVVASDDGKKHATCKTCGLKVSAKAGRVRKHFVACRELDKEMIMLVGHEMVSDDNEDKETDKDSASVNSK